MTAKNSKAKKSASAKAFKANFGPTLRTAPGKVIFPNIARAVAFQEGQEKKYSCSLIMKADDPAVAELREAVDKVGRKSFADWDEGEYYRPIVDGEEILEKSEKAPESLYSGRVRILAKGSVDKDPPTVYLADGSKMPRRPGNEDDLKMIEETIYPGCYARMAVTPFSFNVGKSQGVGLILKAVRFVAEGERLSGADVDALMSEEEELGTEYNFDDETGLGGDEEEAEEANV